MKVDWIELILFLVGVYFIFFLSFIKKFGSRIADLATASDVAKIEGNVKLSFDKQLEDYKKEINKELVEIVEPIKSELNKSNITHQIQFEFLHKERSKVILEFYNKLQKLHFSVLNYTALIHPIIEDSEKEENERIENANKSFHEFRKFYFENKLFFPKSFCDDIDLLLEDYRKNVWDYSFRKQSISERELSDELYHKYIEDMERIGKFFDEKISPKIIEIEDAFRKNYLNVVEK